MIPNAVVAQIRNGVMPKFEPSVIFEGLLLLTTNEDASAIFENTSGDESSRFEACIDNRICKDQVPMTVIVIIYPSYSVH